jgi:hypothetical protein
VRKIGLGVAALLLAACAQKNIDTKDAVRDAVMDYLSTRQAQTGLDVSTMDVEVTEMRFEKDLAQATVAFRIKNTDSGMNMSYTMDRKGDKWVVRPRQDSDNPHGNVMPGAVVPGSGVLPGSGAPGDSGALPPGHPAVGSKAPAGSKAPVGSKE